jgi:hypothetical protein
MFFRSLRGGSEKKAPPAGGYFSGSSTHQVWEKVEAVERVCRSYQTLFSMAIIVQNVAMLNNWFSNHMK